MAAAAGVVDEEAATIRTTLPLGGVDGKPCELKSHVVAKGPTFPIISGYTAFWGSNIDGGSCAVPL